jgi:hypothetical protein
MKTVTLCILCAIVGAGCAARPESIQPSYVSPITYDAYSCDQMAQKASRLSAALSTASKQQSDARTNDTVGVLLIGLPVGSMGGQAIAPEIARLKGEKDALQQSQIRKNCAFVPEPVVMKKPPAPVAIAGKQP